MILNYRNESFDLEDASDQHQQYMEEEVGLLHETNSHTQSISHSLSEHREMHHHHKRPGPWTLRTTITTLLLLLFTLIFIIFLPIRTYHHLSPGKIRPETDYILNPTWSTSAPPTTRTYKFHIAQHELSPDGVPRPMLLINSTFPGPLLELNTHDILAVRVINASPNATSIHWHGIFQNGSNWMDGTTGVTNCPTAPGQEFTYRFSVSGQTGTYWYHSYVEMQASDGLVGPLIIHARSKEGEDRLQKVPYKQDRVLLVSDHYYTPSSSPLRTYLSPGTENAEPVPPTALINGRNVRNCSTLSHRHRASCSSSHLSLARFTLDSESNTRLRIINVGVFAEFALQIDEHEVQVVEVDGTDVVPVGVHRVNIAPAQRYSVVLTPPEKGDRVLYWMRARVFTHSFAYEEAELQEEVRGVVEYRQGFDGGGEGDIPESRDWSDIIDVECKDLNTSTLVPVAAIPAPEIDPRYAIYLRSSFQSRDWRLSRGYFNDSSFRRNATRPILQTMLDSTGAMQENITEGFVDEERIRPEQALVYRTTGTRTITILIQNFDDGAHPMHLHGYKFFILGSGHGYPPMSLL
ncbi:Multicopper oxidase [Pyrenophora tritici-repentis]|uniref:Multicopper oxidase n=2 Tax=Pyrenophora tritici-repentis TaxID=45151 RepID=A0A5M9LK20_9PLEO|nr:L-ascorbate oxidase [Pyrenophora tritici-repentis Pt-1C-BFP]KAA8625313.1 Multicopper oxidase [Pyrenophora tritici-repentis]EDU40135.1 L-ascorbate oxidase [Pyrenophora tritici-repentis Pt-1C-BFP]KAF7576800.1 SufI, putative multicopper oxidase [Pyrenophora tritici-repentis]KAI1520589.1 Multicopper oxidase [Pyrenophora tritici-repentis]KAI1534504.1 SufI multicopper oxidase [Pyrenophora tritici-repentis]